MTWHADAACHPDRKPVHMSAQEWNRIWFPNPSAPIGRPPEKKSTADMYAAARVYCGRCPVRQECLTEAMLNGERIGMFGGHSPQERRVLRWRPRRCRWCDTVFTVDLPDGRQNGAMPSFCCDEHRQASRNQDQAAYVVRRATENYEDVDLECETCGHESPNRSGLTLHRKMAHGEAA